ncbi:hypothetical protein PVAND_003964 [Polypedilum vanderplanki]|uniref:Radial spoke head protein 9 homolog n=1 Tax=Polypedilum vanderplanki TaxID=319348 RepID=A0A9J6BW95_POLVA|nr:hypothetical protein PVAND_003964 [Polypedilum vanderplanki]
MKDILHRLDRAMIYIFIAGSYYPWLTLENFKYPSIATFLRWLIWVLALIGVLYQQIFHERYKCVETIFIFLIGLTPAIILVTVYGHEFIAMVELEIGGIFYFVGVIFFKSDDGSYYYIAFGYKNDILKDRKFFYSLNAYEWIMIPHVKSKLLTIALQARTLFTGDPMNIEMVCMYPTFVDNKEIKTPCPERIKRLKEEDKLACIVHMIMSESAIIPKGVLYRQVTRNITYNPCFKGLNNSEAEELINFQLFRYPLNNQNYNLTKHIITIIKQIFLIRLMMMFLKNNFTHSINDRNLCIIRSLNWPE